MKRYHKMTPEGMRDLLFEECAAVKDVGRRASELFKNRGYHEVITPTTEYYDVFETGDAEIVQETAYKLIDTQGRILVLRPDSTSPIARFTATRLRDAEPPIRLCYTQNVFRMSKGMSGHSNETVQSGIELIGVNGLLSDIEVLCIAAETFKAVGLSDFRMELGHAGLFRCIADGIPVEESVKEELREAVESKNGGALQSLISKLPDMPETRALSALPRLFGGAEVLRHPALLACEAACEPLSYLEKVYGALGELSLDAGIQIDLGLVHRNEYYTGLVFRGYIAGSGEAVISGGRYDHLLERFGSPHPAIGFALDLNAIAGALPGSVRQEVKFCDVLVAALKGHETEAVRRWRELLESGLRCELLECGDIETAKESARRRGIPRVEMIGEASETGKERKI